MIVGKQKMCSNFLYDGYEREREKRNKKKKEAKEIKNEQCIRVVTLNRTFCSKANSFGQPWLGRG